GGKAWGSWPKVDIGFLLHTITGAVLAGCAGVGLIGLLLLFIGELATSPSLQRAGVIVGAIGAILFLVLEIPAIVAYIMCLFSPNKRGAMVWAIVVLSVGVLGLVFRIIWGLIPAINSFSTTRGDFLAQFSSAYEVPIVLVGSVGSISVAGTIIVSILILLPIYAEYVLLPLSLVGLGPN